MRQDISWIPNKLTWRQIKFRLEDDSFVTLPQISSKKQLQKYVNRFEPVDIYYSAGYFLNPHRIENSTYEIHRLFMFCDICIDLDDVYPSQVDKVINLLGEPEYCLQTSKDSYQLIYSPEKLKGKTTKQRIKSFISSRKRLVKLLRENNINADYPITLDYRRVIRYPLSYHRTGFKTKFHNPLQDRGQSRENDDELGLSRPIIHEGIKETSPNPPLIKIINHYMFTKFKKQRVLFLKYKKINVDELITLQKIYKTGSLYIFYYTNEKEYGVLSLKGMDLRRIRKIAKASKAINKSLILNNNLNYIQVNGVKKKYSLKCPSLPLETYSPYHRTFIKHLRFEVEGVIKKPIVKKVTIQRRLRHDKY